MIRGAGHVLRPLLLAALCAQVGFAQGSRGDTGPPGDPWPKPAAARPDRAWVEALAKSPFRDVEPVIAKALLAGEVPPHLRSFVSVKFVAPDGEGVRRRVEIWALPDYLAVGTQKSFFRTPLTPASAQKIADTLGGVSLPTRALVDRIHEAAAVKLEPKPLTEAREALATFLQHHDLVETSRRGQSGLISGIKKDVVITKQLSERRGKVAIYGWHRRTGKPIQPLYLGHTASYVDYSHGIRFISTRVRIDGKLHKFGEVLEDPILHPLLSDEGPIPRAAQQY